MRDRIADIIWDNCHDGENGQQLDVAADAIIAALPSMVAPLVWEDNGLDELWASGYSITSDRPDKYIWWPPYGDGLITPTESQAKAAANAHHVAQIMAAFAKPEAKA